MELQMSQKAPNKVTISLERRVLDFVEKKPETIAGLPCMTPAAGVYLLHFRDEQQMRHIALDDENRRMRG